MNSIIRTLIKFRRIKPDLQKRDAFRSELVARVEATGPRAHRPRFALFPAFRPSTLAALCSVIIILGASGVSFAAQGALPGELLYPVKIATEKVRVATAQNDVQKTELRLEFAGRRLNEVQALINKGTATPEKTGAALAQYEKTLEESSVALAGDKDKTAGIATAIENATEAQARVADKISESVRANPSFGDLNNQLQHARNNIEEKGDAALLSIVSTASETSSALPKKILDRSRETVAKKEEKVNEAARTIEEIKSLGGDVDGADTKLKDAETNIKDAKRQFGEGNIRASLEHSMQAQKNAAEANQIAWQKGHHNAPHDDTNRAGGGDNRGEK